MLKFTINEDNGTKAIERIQKLCEDLGIFNPLVSRAIYEIQGPQESQNPNSN